MKMALAFMTGVLAMAAVVYITGARLAAPMFFAGAVAVLVPVVGYLSSVKRIRTAARFLYSFADAWEGTQSGPVAYEQCFPNGIGAGRSTGASGYRKPSRKQQEADARFAAEEYRDRMKPDVLDDADEIFGVSPSRRAS